MKKKTLLLLLFLGFQYSFSQVLNLPANWPNANWDIERNLGLNTNNPTFMDDVFAYNDHYEFDHRDRNRISATRVMSPVIDLTAAKNAGETGIQITFSYNFHSSRGVSATVGIDNNLRLQYFNADAGVWQILLPANQISLPATSDEFISTPSVEAYCTPTKTLYTSIELNIANFTPNQLTNFRYAISYSDKNGLGMCVTSPTIFSKTPEAIVQFDDITFKNRILAIGGADLNQDNEIQLSEAAALTGTLDIRSRNINSLTGINAFINITELNCSDNNLTSLDISNLANLNTVFCSDNQLSSISLPQNNNDINLRIFCFNNQLTSLDLSNTFFRVLRASNNALTTLNVKNGANTNVLTMTAPMNSDLRCVLVDDINFSSNAINWQIDDTANYSTDYLTGCQALSFSDINFENALLNHSPTIDTNNDGIIQEREAEQFTSVLNISNKNISDLSGIEAFENISILNFSQNNLNAVDLSQNTFLISLDSFENNLTELDLSQNTLLESINTSNNLIEMLDLSSLTVLREILANNNSLSFLNLKNGNNTNMTLMNAQSNINLNCIAVDDTSFASTAAGWTIDTAATYGTTCDDTALSNDNISESFHISNFIYPNPSSGTFNLSNVPNSSLLEIYAISGKKVFEILIENTRDKINTSLSPGFYIAVINNEIKVPIIIGKTK